MLFCGIGETTINSLFGALNNRCASPDSVETVSFDAGWQTRGSGRNYASHTGNFIYN